MGEGATKERLSLRFFGINIRVRREISESRINAEGGVTVLDTQSDSFRQFK